MKAALYIRVSTQEQVENYSIGSQKERLAALCKAKGWTVYETYVDGGYSGSNIDRPALQKLLSELNKIDVVVVYKLDRLSRSQRDTLTLIEDHFLKNNVDFVSISETLDTSTPFGKAMIGILAVFAQLERETIAERMRMGHIKRAEEGLRGNGGDYDPSGYERKEGKLIIKPDEAEHIQQAFDLYEQYHSITKVQNNLKEMGYTVWRFRRYRDILRNRLYIGEVSFAGEHYKGQHEPIISKEQFERVQVLLERHKGPNAHKAKQSLLSGLITCGHCGESYVTYNSGYKGKNDYRYYQCRARRFPSEYDEKCKNKNWNADKLDALIQNRINMMISEQQTTEKKVKRIDYDKPIKAIDKKLERLIMLYTNDKIDPDLLDKQLDQLNEEKQHLINKKKSQDEQTTPTEDLNLFDFDKMSFSRRQAAVNKLIDQITIYDGTVSIDWTF